MIQLDVSTGMLSGKEVITSEKKRKDLQHVFKDEKSRATMNQDETMYKVQAFMPEEEGKAGGLFFGNSTVYPGKVGDEYNMTRGHFHAKKDTAEYYWCIAGEGALILMDQEGKCWFEKMTPGSVHYIHGNVAHRVANTGKIPLTFNACWPSDAGHDYESIAKNGFSARLMDVNGVPTLI
jgi:glucose-6-phosphate isomerase, archaeal